MNAPLRRVAVVVMLLFGLLFVNLNWVQAYRADDYRTSPYNGRVQLDEYKRQRGIVMAADGKELALSKSTTDSLKYLRSYPFKEAYAHVLGYKPVNIGSTGLEQTENEFLAGTSDRFVVDRFWDMVTGERSAGGNVVSSLSRTAQETAYKELKGNRKGAKVGAVIALDPKTGAIKAMVSLPSYDPNAIVSHDREAAQAAYDKYLADPSRPMLNRAVSEIYPPASTFKVLVAAAALQNGYNPSSLVTAGLTYQPPDTSHVIHNSSSSTCPEERITLDRALTVSCNTAFARLGVEMGSRKLIETVTSFGFYDSELTVGRSGGTNAHGVKVAESTLGNLANPDGRDNKPKIALSSFGQSDVRMSPLQGALVAAAIANKGEQMRPYLVEQLVGPDLTKHYVAKAQLLRKSCEPGVAKSLQDMMVNVVEEGTGKNAQIDGYLVAGKTGTAQDGDGDSPHGWFIGFAKKGDEPVAAVAVFLENAGKGGSAEAARIAGQVMRGVIADKGGK